MRKIKSEVTFESLKPKLIGLGFSFYGSPESADPETEIVSILGLASDEPKLFRMLLAWLDKTRELIHVERLKVLATDLAQDALISLGVMALKQVKCGDRRFSILVDFVKKKLSAEDSRNSYFSKNADPYLIEKYGVDHELLEFGIKAQEIQPSDTKKILTLKGVLALSSWLKMRTLIGANFRADIAYVMAKKLAHNPYQAAKLVGCSQETAYRLWKGLQLYPAIELLAA